MLKTELSAIMFNHPINTIDLEITNKCGLFCPGCNRQKFFNGIGSKIPGEDISIKVLQKTLDTFDSIIFCGRISDPLYHKDFYKILNTCVKHSKKNPKQYLEIRHASVIKNMKMYKKYFLLSKLHNNIMWVFAIDGLPNQSHLYRKNQDGEFLFEVMKVCSKMGIKTRWDYLIFDYNKNNIETCKQMSLENNIIFNPIVSGVYWSSREDFIKSDSKYHNNQACYISDVVNINETKVKIF